MGNDRRPLRALGLGLALVAIAVAGYLLKDVFANRDLTVIVISLDTTRPDHLSAYGYDRPTTPNIARLVSEGTRFDAAHSATSWTLPSHMSLFTGLPPGLHDVNIDFQVLDKSRRTMGEIFHDGGFRTMGVYSAPYVHGHYGFGRGFQYYERGTQDPMLFDLTPAQMHDEAASTEARSHTEVTSKLVVDRGINLLRNSNNDRNLMFLHFFDPHYDYLAPPRIARNFIDPAYRGTLTGADIDQRSDVWDGTLSDADKHQLVALYDAELAWVDENVGRLLDELKAEGRLDRTLIVLVGDHGEEFYEHGRYGHRNGLSEQTLHIPLIVWGPGLGVPAGRTIPDVVANYDVLPTLIDYAGLPQEPTLYGRSLRPLIEGRSLPPRPVASALTFIPRHPEGYYTLYRSVIFNGLKVVDTEHVKWSPQDERRLDGDVLPGSEQISVYDLQSDPLEAHDLSESGDPRVKSVLAAYSDESARQLAQLKNLRKLGAPEGSDIGLNLEETLRAFGYVGHDDAGAAAAGAAPGSGIDFSATPITGSAPLQVRFSDVGGDGRATGWSWTFGDGGTSTERQPSHTYATSGSYTVALTVTGPSGSGTQTKSAFIVVTAPPSPAPQAPK